MENLGIAMLQISHTFTFEGEKDGKGRHATAQGLIKTGDTVEITFIGAREEPISLKRWNPVWEMDDSISVMGEVFYFKILVGGKSLLLGQWADYRYTDGSTMGGGVKCPVERTSIGDEQVRSAYSGLVNWLSEGAKENNYWHSLYMPKDFPKEAVVGMPGESAPALEDGQHLWEPGKIYEEGHGVFSVDGLRYQLTDSELKLMPLTFGAKYSGDLVIPEHVTYKKQTYPVVWIHQDAFDKCDALESISIPGTVKSRIHLPAGNPPLKSITVGEACTVYKTIDGVLFSKDGTDLIKYPRLREGEEYDIPPGVVSIEREAFSGAASLRRVTFPDGLKYIDSYAFEGCTNLESVVLPASMKDVKSSAFRKCSNIKSFTVAPNQYFDLSGVPATAFPWGKPAFAKDGLTFGPFLDHDHPVDLQARVFLADEDKEWARGVEELSIPAKMMQYGHEYAVTECRLDFNDFPSLRKLYIPHTMRKISLTRCRAGEVVLDPWNPFFLLEGCLLLDSELTRVVSVVKGKCPKKLVIPEGVQTIGSFSGIDEELEEVILPDTVTTLEDDCFKGCRNLREIHLGANLKNVGAGAFQQCGIVSLTLPPTLKKLARKSYCSEHQLFDGCDSLKEFRMEGDGDVYFVRDGVLYRKYGSSSILCLCPPRHCEGEFEVPEGTNYIGESAFSDNVGLTEVLLPDSLKKICSWAFNNCTSLSAVLFNSDLDEIDSFAFRGCTSLEAVAVPKSVEDLDYRAFAECKNLKILRLPPKFEHDRTKFMLEAHR